MAKDTIRQYTIEELQQFQNILGAQRYSSGGSTYQLALVKRIQEVLTSEDLFVEEQFTENIRDKYIATAVISRYPEYWHLVPSDLRNDEGFVKGVIEEQFRIANTPSLEAINVTLNSLSPLFFENELLLSECVIPTILRAQKATMDFRLKANHTNKNLRSLLLGELSVDTIFMSHSDCERLLSVEPLYALTEMFDAHDIRRTLPSGIAGYCSGFNIPSGDDLLVKRSSYINGLAHKMKPMK